MVIASMMSMFWCSCVLFFDVSVPKKMQRDIILLFLLLMGVASADLLQNPDFESPPTNLSANSTSLVLLKETNTIPGWTFEGTVLYVKASQYISLPENGHAIQLGQDGKIKQTFTANGDIVTYLLTFTLALGGPVNCTANASLAISAPDSSTVFSVKQHFGKQTWQRYGHYLQSTWEVGVTESTFKQKFSL